MFPEKTQILTTVAWVFFKLRKFEINSDKSALPFLSPMLNSVYLTLFQGRLSFLVASSTASSKEAEQYDYAKSGGLR